MLCLTYQILMRNKRLPALEYSLFQVRTALRLRFRRLPYRTVADRLYLSEELTPPLDMDVLRLLQAVVIIGRPPISQASLHYEELRDRSDNDLPTFQEVLNRGWIREIGGAATEATTLHEFFRHESIPFAQEFNEFVYRLREGAVQLNEDFDCGTAEQLKHYLLAPRSHSCPPFISAGWIAARLWDTSAQPNLQEWTRKWEILSHPRISPSHAWPDYVASAFRAAVLNAVRSSGLPTWEEGDPMSAVRYYGDVRTGAGGSVEPQLLAKHLLLYSPAHSGAWAYDPAGLTALVGQLILELPHLEAGPVPSDTVSAIVDLAMTYPDVLSAVTGYLHQSPEALADFALYPPATALVCYLVATWNRDVSVDRDSRDGVQMSIQNELLHDCLAVLAHFLQQEQVAPEEYCQLIIAVNSLELISNQLSGVLPLLVEHLSTLPLDVGIAIRDSFIQRCSRKGSLREFAMMLRVIAAVESGVAKNAELICKTYSQFFAEAAQLQDLFLIDGAGAASLLQVALTQPAAVRDEVLHPIDLRRCLERGDSAWTLSEAVRSHIRVLCRAIASYPEEIPDALVGALAKTIHAGACDRPSKGQVDAFVIEINFSRQHQPPITADLLAAMRRLSSPSQQKKVLNALLQVEEPIVLAQLSMRLPNPLKFELEQRLAQLQPEAASRAAFVPHIEQRIATLLDAGFPELAALYIAEFQQRRQGQWQPEQIVERLRSQLQLNYLRSELSTIRATIVPPELKGVYREEAHRTIEFFRALALLKDAAPDPGAAAGIFLRLYNQTKNLAFAINLLAARVNKLLGGNLFATVTGEAANQAKAALKHADNALGDSRTLTPEARTVHLPNCAAMLLALNQPHEALLRLQELAPVERSVESIAYEAVANFRVGDLGRANAIIRAGKIEHGAHAEVLVGAENHIAHATPHSAAASVLLKNESQAQLRAALKSFMGLSPATQASVLVEGPLPLEQIMCGLMQDALAAFVQLLSSLKLHKNEFDEDDYNAILAEIAQARVEAMFGWQAHEQSPGGVTSKGNPGRRDWALKKGGVAIAVFEALKAARPTDKAITEHFHKLFGYSQAAILFHVTYAMNGNVDEFKEAIEDVARNPPLGTSCIGHGPIASEGARPGGLRGAYRRDGLDVAVLFYVIDMRQSGMRQAVGAPQPKANI
jgi:hypothetical protein